MPPKKQEPDERVFLQIRNRQISEKTLEELLELAGKIPNLILGDDELMEKYAAAPEKDEQLTVKRVCNKGECWNLEPNPGSTRIKINTQVSKTDLKVLEEWCNKRQLVQAVKMLPEHNFSIRDTWRQVQSVANPSPCFQCGVVGCLRRQERWHGRVIHGMFPNVPISEFLHDKSDRIPSCYFVPQTCDIKILTKFEDAFKKIKEIDRHG
ncbi:unnamed protein product [Caenorhabditis nigoni]|uniref:Uncharacterized protein n=1 Tax=Caenorhabditis nigoni TaxID=1611254 RepID=A0A2G5SS47_9PELO|nr:hypothetical protein B9Z55_023838 [Caenorhabditis nigoni]